MNTWVIIGLIVIALHLIIGFGWLLYKLTVPPKKKEDIQNGSNDSQK